MNFNNNCYAFNECSILKLCEIKIPSSFQIFFNKERLTAKNHSKIKKAIQKLEQKNMSKLRFVPSENLENNIIKTANEILKGYSIQMLGAVFKAQIIEQLEEFYEKIISDFREINKEDKIDKIKEIFQNNERGLKKETNIPEDDDMKIIAGYKKYECEGKKYFITEDEHFWGYSDLILDHFNIHVIEEWKCNLINI